MNGHAIQSLLDGLDRSLNSNTVNKRTGNFWNRNSKLSITPVTASKVKQDLLDLLSESERFAPKRQPLPAETATQLMLQFMDFLGSGENNSFYVVEPDFLFTVEENNEDRLGYFEQLSRDYVLLIVKKKEGILNILLTNGYG